MMINILHITPHMGGGVGKVISKLATYNNSRINHKIVIQEIPKSYQYIDNLKKNDVEFLICPNEKILFQNISEADLIIIHWWHHPKTTKLFYEFPIIPTRIIIWSHISNITVPSLDLRFIYEVNKVFFTTPASYDAYDLEKDNLKNKTSIVYGCGGIEDFPKVNKVKHEGFNVGYLGLVDFSKLNPKFMDYCKSIEIPETNFLFAGECTIKEKLEAERKEKCISNKFKYLGHVNDIIQVLSLFDVFGYPLMEYHTCTTENSILEAMAAEVVPVLINQLTEKYIVENGKTGFLVSGAEEYGQVMRYIYNNPDKRKEIGKNARKYVVNKYNSNSIQNELYENCVEIMEQPKRIFNFKHIVGNSPEKWFLSGTGKDRKILEDIIENRSNDLNFSPLLKQSNKGSVFHYEREFHDNKKIRKIADLIRKELNNKM